MISLSAKKRENKKGVVGQLRDSGRIPGVVYGHKVENVLLDMDAKEFGKILKEAGESSLIELHIEGDKEKRPVLIHELQKNPVTDEFTHVDFFQASLKEKVEVEVPLVFEGVSTAVKDLGGTLVRNMSEITVRALPQDLPHEIKVSIDSLKTFEDRILVKDLRLPEGVKATAQPDEIVAAAQPPADVEEDLATPVEENVEDVERVEKEKKEEEVVDEPNEKK